MQDLSVLKNKSLWKTIGGFDFYTDSIRSGQRLWASIPDGFVTDGATIPRLFWSWIPPMGPYGQAAVLHDYLRQTMILKTSLEADAQTISLSIKDTDRLFLEAMTVLNVPVFKREVMYDAVRVYAVVIKPVRQFVDGLL